MGRCLLRVVGLGRGRRGLPAGTDGPEVGGLTSWEILRACEMVGARKPVLMDIVELIPAYDLPALISHRLACYFIFHLLGGWATGAA